MSHLDRETGIALPVTIFVVTLLTIILAASFVRVAAERSVAVGTGDAVRALAVAQSGLQSYLASRTSRPPDGDSVRFNVVGGYADVVARVVQKPADTMLDQMYIVRSTGHVIVPALGATWQAVRTVAQFGKWQTPALDAIAAFTGANRVRRRAGGVVLDIRGADQCGGLQPAVYGLRARTASTVSPTTGITGSPAGYLQGGGGLTVATLAGIDWPTITGGGFTPDYYSFRAGDASYPSMLIQGNLTLQDTDGYGLLIVTGDLTIQSLSFIWNGIILVGGKIDFNATDTWIYGNVKSGLNEQLGGPAPPEGQFAGTGRSLRLYYHSCRVQQALNSLRGFAPIRNAWVDNWASY